MPQIEKQNLKNYKHHYLISVGINTDTLKVYIDTFYEFSDEQMQEHIMSSILFNLNEEKKKKTIVQELDAVYHLINVRSNLHNLKKCLYHTDFVLERDDLEEYLNNELTIRGAKNFWEFIKESRI